mmetsp:Transcript_25904/g.66658  ORF Transcript_25904/g.66658 Transcript_25904/m.66658 type:complete len:200 (-) Transcript_25904:125-724(-)
MRWSGLRREPGGAPTTTITTAMTAAPHHSGNSLVRGVRRGKGRALWQWRGGRGRRGIPPGRPPTHLPFFSCTPRMRDILPRICGLGMALPFSYSLMICGFSLIACASCACVIFFARRACWICFFSSELTRLWLSSSVSRSSLAALMPVWVLPPPDCFLTVSTAAPDRRAWLTAAADLDAPPWPPAGFFRSTTSFQSCPL